MFSLSGFRDSWSICKIEKIKRAHIFEYLSLTRHSYYQRGQEQAKSCLIDTYGVSTSHFERAGPGALYTFNCGIDFLIFVNGGSVKSRSSLQILSGKKKNITLASVVQN